jgi:hypothetical protein
MCNNCTADLLVRLIVHVHVYSIGINQINKCGTNVLTFTYYTLYNCLSLLYDRVALPKGTKQNLSMRSL